MAPTVRPVEPGDLDRVREVAERSMTASYDLSPQGIEAILQAEFASERTGDRLESEDAYQFVARSDDGVIGYAEGRSSDGAGEIRWLHVHPAFRGNGAGTALFEHLVSALEDDLERGVERVRVIAGVEGEEFVERFGFEQTDQREVEIGDRRIVEHVYTDDADVDDGFDSDAQSSDAAVPETITAEDDNTVYIGEERIAGVEGPFARTYDDPDRSSELGYYCGHCGSTDVSMDSMERLSCGECGNLHRPDDDYDESYL